MRKHLPILIPTKYIIYFSAKQARSGRLELKKPRHKSPKWVKTSYERDIYIGGASLSQETSLTPGASGGTPSARTVLHESDRG